MADQTTDSATQAGTAAQPSATASQTQAGQPNSQGSAEMPEWAKALQKDNADLRKLLQSDKDRGIAKVSKELDSIKPILERVKQIAGLDDKQVVELQDQLEYDEIRRRVLNPNTQIDNPASLGSGAANVASPAESLVSKFQMDTADPQVKQAIIDANGDTSDLALRLANLKVTRATAPQPNSANASPPAGGAPVGALSRSDIEEKAAKLNQLLLEPTKNAREIAALEKVLDEAKWGG